MTIPALRRMLDESTLELEGARAAAAGWPWHSNPYLHRANMPPATGDSVTEWSRKHDAWQRGYEGGDDAALP